MRRIALQVANAVIFVLCAYLAASVFNQVSAGLLGPDEASALAALPPAASPATGRKTHQIIRDRDLFGTGNAEPETDVATEVVEPTVETRLPLKLLGTVPSTDPTYSSAAIQDQGSRKHEVVRIGDKLQNYQQVEVVAIERQRIVLKNGERHEELKLKEEDGTTASRPRSVASRRSSRPSRAARSRPRAPGTDSTSLADRLQELRGGKDGNPRNAAALFSQARILPKYDDGEMVGMEISGIKEGSLYEAIGFKDGDVVTAVNDVEITSAADTAKILNMFTKEDELRIMKNGELITVSGEELEAFSAGDE